MVCIQKRLCSPLLPDQLSAKSGREPEIADAGSGRTDLHGQGCFSLLLSFARYFRAHSSLYFCRRPVRVSWPRSFCAPADSHKTLSPALHVALATLQDHKQPREYDPALGETLKNRLNQRLPDLQEALTEGQLT